MVMNPLMEVNDASFSYNGKDNVFEGISFSIEKGDVMCILGPNGTGKTTLIKCLNGLQRINSGDITVDGRSIYSMTKIEKSRYVGYIPQGHQTTFPFKSLDIVLMGRTPFIGTFSSASKKDLQIAKNAMGQLGILHLADKPYTAISGGERQMVFVARVLAQGPKILILDEPTSHLDFGNQMKTLSVIGALARQGMAIIMSSHFPDQAFISSNKTAIMKDKRMMCFGMPEAVVTEENMKKAYGVPVKIVEIGSRKACVPLDDESGMSMMEIKVNRNA
jgi:iron complex transport system ATP-binding protein